VLWTYTADGLGVSPRRLSSWGGISVARVFDKAVRG
jgi:hypothetical protein